MSLNGLWREIERIKLRRHLYKAVPASRTDARLSWR
jgi:hypothetical protein